MTARRGLLAAAALLPAACTAGPPPCPAGTRAATVAEAYFGQGLPGGPQIGEAAWQGFLADTVTPAFPEGLTVLDGSGQWRAPDGRVVRERSRVLVVVLPGATAEQARARLRPVETAWKARFRQQSVLSVVRDACVGF